MKDMAQPLGSSWRVMNDRRMTMPRVMAMRAVDMVNKEQAHGLRKRARVRCDGLPMSSAALSLPVDISGKDALWWTGESFEGDLSEERGRSRLLSSMLLRVLILPPNSPLMGLPRSSFCVDSADGTFRNHLGEGGGRGTGVGECDG